MTQYIKKNILFTLLATVLMIGLNARPGMAQQDGDIVKVKSSASVEKTVANLKKMVADNGMMVMGNLNQGQALSMTGISVNSQSLFVGNPQVGKKLFSAERGAGVVVPIRINIYEDVDGQTWVAYIPPSTHLSEFDNPKVTKVAGMLDKKLQKMTGMIK